MVHTRSKRPQNRTSGKEDANCNSLIDNVPSRTSKRKNDVSSFEKSSGKSEKSTDKCTSNKITEKPTERTSRKKERVNCAVESTSGKEAAIPNKATPEKEKCITTKRTTRSAGRKVSNKSLPINSKGLDASNHLSEQNSCESEDTTSVVVIKREPEVKTEPVEPGESSCDRNEHAMNVLTIPEDESNKSNDLEPMQPIVVRVKTEPKDFEETDRPQLSGFSMEQLSSFFSGTALLSQNYRDVLRIRSGKRQLLLKIIEHVDRQTVLPETFANKNWLGEKFFKRLETAFVFGELTRDANFLEYQREEEKMACVGLTRQNYAKQFQIMYAKHKVEANEAYTTERKRSRRRGPVPDYSELASGSKRFPKFETRACGAAKRNGSGNSGGNSRTAVAQSLSITQEGSNNSNISRGGKGKSTSHSSAEGLSRGSRGRGSNRPSRCPSPAEPDDDETDNCELSDEEVLMAVQRETAAEAEDARRPEQRQRRKVAGMGNFMKWKYCYSDEERGKRAKRRKPPIEDASEMTTVSQDQPNNSKRQKLAPELSPVPETKAAGEAIRGIKRKAPKEISIDANLAPTPSKLTPFKANETKSSGSKLTKEAEDKDVVVVRTKRVLKEEVREEGEVCVPSSSRTARLNELNSILRQLVHNVIKNPAQMEFNFDPPKVRLRNITPDQFCDIVQESTSTPFMVHNASTTPVVNPNGPGLGLCYHAHIGLRNEDDKSPHDTIIRPERIPSKLPNIRPKLPVDGNKSHNHSSSVSHNTSGAPYKSNSGFMPRQRKLRAKIAPRREALPTPSHVPPQSLPLPPQQPTIPRQPPQLAPKPTTSMPIPAPSSFDSPGPSIFPRKTPIPRPVPKETEKPLPPAPAPPVDTKETPTTSTGGSTGRILVKATCFQPRRPQTKLEPLDDINSDDSDQLALDADLKHRIISEVPLNSKSLMDSRGLRDAMRRMGRRKTDPDIHPVTTRRMNKKVVRKMYTGSECVPSILKRPLNTGPAIPPASTSLSPLRPNSGAMPSASAATSSMRPAPFPRVEYRRPVTSEYRFGSPLKVQLDNRGRYVDPYKPAERHEETPATALTASERLKLKKFNSDDKPETRTNQQRPSGPGSTSGGSGKPSSKNDSCISSGPAVLGRNKFVKLIESGEESDFELSEATHPFKVNVSPPSSTSSGSVSILTPLTTTNPLPSPVPGPKVTPPGTVVSSSNNNNSGSVHVKILPKPEGSPARSSTLSARPLIHEKATAQGGFRRILPRPENALTTGATGACNGVSSGSGGNIKATRAQEHPVVPASNSDTQNITAIQRRPLDATDAEPPNLAVSPHKQQTQECQMAVLKAILRQKGQMNVAGEAATAAATTSDSSGAIARRVTTGELPGVLPTGSAPLTPARPVAAGLSSSSSAGSLRVPPASSYTNPQNVSDAQSPRSNSQPCLNPIRIRMTRLKTPGAFGANESPSGGSAGIPLGLRPPEENDPVEDGTNSR